MENTLKSLELIKYKTKSEIILYYSVQPDQKNKYFDFSIGQDVEDKKDKMFESIITTPL